MYSLLLLFINFSLASNCEDAKVINSFVPKHAKYFSYTQYEKFKIVRSGPENEKDNFIVTSEKLNCETTLPVIKTPVNRFIATSTTHLPFLDFFHLEDNLVAFQGTNYISNPKLRTRKIAEISYQLNSEQLLHLKPDLIMGYKSNLPSWKSLKDYRRFNLPLVLNWDFLEEHPLARAEWLVFNSVFFNKEIEAKKLFEKMESDYAQLKRTAVNLRKKRVLVGDIQNGKWVTCGGQSDLALLIKDAGGQLVLDNDKSQTQFMPLESVYPKSKTADVWLPQNTWRNLKILKSDDRYGPLLKLEIFNNTKMLNVHGFNDYWETGLARPDLMIKDLFQIFHPEVKKGDTLWYKKLYE